MKRSRDDVYMASQLKRPVVSSRGESLFFFFFFFFLFLSVSLFFFFFFLNFVQFLCMCYLCLIIEVLLCIR
jgi:hypothetical protein